MDQIYNYNYNIIVYNYIIMFLLHSVLSRLAVKGIPFLYKSKVHQGINCPIALESSLHAIKKAREYMFGYLEDHMAGQTWRE